MQGNFSSEAITLNWLPHFLFPLILFWIILLIQVPSSFGQYFHHYSLGLFIAVIVLYYSSFKFSGRVGLLLSLGLTMALLSLSLSYIWRSGFSDNFVIGGLLPYKDAKNYYFGANLLLDGLRMMKAGQATERPLFPGFLATILWITGQNLKITLGLIVQFVGLGIYFSSRQIRNTFGRLASSLFAALLYFYIQPFVGYSLSELLGFLAGCLGFTLIWLASLQRNRTDLLLAVAILLLGVSARAGAFFIFPMLVLWAGWLFRGERLFSLRAAAYAFVLIFVLYFLTNPIYSRLLGIPPGSAFGNFSYALYGQVRGGTGWHSAIEEVGTRNPAVVYQAAFSYFRKHPIGLLIGFAQSYRDFFLPGDRSIFPFSGSGWQSGFNIVLWLGVLVSFWRGLIHLYKNIHSNLASLLLAGFIGILLSIPFLPPIDGGARFHAGTMPFFFAPIVAGTIGSTKRERENTISDHDVSGDIVICRYASLIVLAMVLLVPIMIRLFSTKSSYANVACTAGQQPFVIESHPGSYIDLIQYQPAQCGSVPQVCLNDFERNNIELVTDDYYQTLISLAKSDEVNIRLIPAINLIDDKFHYFYLPLDHLLDSRPSKLIAGCAVEIQTKDQSIFQVKSVFPHGN